MDFRGSVVHSHQSARTEERIEVRPAIAKIATTPAAMRGEMENLAEEERTSRGAGFVPGGLREAEIDMRFIDERSTVARRAGA
jgi:hypothetical protein